MNYVWFVIESEHNVWSFKVDYGSLWKKYVTYGNIPLSFHHVHKYNFWKQHDISERMEYFAIQYTLFYIETSTV